ncbi:MAG TPA: ABC transporter ATP-binding protein [Gemmataceae bacterium]|nr:ABC transporter ATP-binding protein [Gemmataceae bacterium]
MTTAVPVIAARGLTKVFGPAECEVVALRDLDFAVHSGEFVAVMGRSGSGKSTLLHLLAGLDRPSGGSVHVGGRDLAALGDDELSLLRRRQVGVVFQDFNLLDVLTAEENVALPLALDGVAPAEARRRAGRALEQVGLAKRARHRPAAMSGGERQRVAVARALAIDPLVLLADEPTGSLDSASGAAVLALLRGLVDEHRHTVVLVTHDPNHAALADRLVVLRDGRACARRVDEAGDVHAA